jgi:hypothetical protein
MDGLLDPQHAYVYCDYDITDYKPMLKLSGFVMDGEESVYKTVEDPPIKENGSMITKQTYDLFVKPGDQACHPFSDIPPESFVGPARCTLGVKRNIQRSTNVELP